MNRHATRLLLRAELLGFARSRVMLVMWVVLPILATLSFFLMPLLDSNAGGGPDMPMTYFMELLLSSIAGTVAAIVATVDVVNERDQKVYDLLAVRPIRRETILWAKFLAVFASVSIASVISVGVGLGIDQLRGTELPSSLLVEVARSIAIVIGVIAVSTAVGVLFAILARSIVVAVMLVLFVGQNLTVIPMLPTLLGFRHMLWSGLLATALVTVVTMWGAGALFRRAEY